MKKAILLIFSLLLLPNIGTAATDYNYILSDSQATDYDSMSEKEIQDFLKEKDSYLSDYWYTGNNPGPIHFAEAKANPEKKFFKKRYASEIIYNAANENKINPKFLLTMLQKEMGLIEDDDPSRRQLGFAMGYYCYDGQRCNSRYKGFGKQVRSTAMQFRYYLDNINEYRFQPGKLSCVGDPNDSLPCTSKGTKVTPDNKITAAMYVYTPHIHGNSLFKILWSRYDFNKDGISDVVGVIPDGALVQAKDGSDQDTIFLIHNGEKLAFENTTSLVSRFDPGKVLRVNSEEIAKFTNGNNIKYANYSILQSPDGKRYLLDNLEKRLIVNDQVFKDLGFNPLEIEEVSSSELSSIDSGDNITSSEISVFEQLVLDPVSNGIYYVKNDRKYPVVSPEIIDVNWPKMRVNNISSEELEGYRKSRSVKLKDGTLVKTENDLTVYVISNGKRRSLSNEETFTGLGYNWLDIKVVSNKVLLLHRLGKAIKYTQ